RRARWWADRPAPPVSRPRRLCTGASPRDVARCKVSLRIGGAGMGRVNRVRPWVATFSAALALVIAAALSLTAAPASARVAYLTDADAKVVRVIDLAAGEVVSPPIPVGHETDEIVISPDGRTAYAVGLNAAELAVIDTET